MADGKRGPANSYQGPENLYRPRRECDCLPAPMVSGEDCAKCGHAIGPVARRRLNAARKTKLAA